MKINSSEQKVQSPSSASSFCVRWRSREARLWRLDWPLEFPPPCPTISPVLRESLKAIHSVANRLALIVVVVVFCGIFVFPLFYSRKKAKEVKAELREIAVALGDYRSETGSWPSPGGRSVAEALLGDGRGKAYSRHSRRDGEGRFVDPWEGPYRFFFSKSGFAIQSAGKDGKYTEGASGVGDDLWFSGGDGFGE